jgi:ASC-1-like (ASCH) protein
MYCDKLMKVNFDSFELSGDDFCLVENEIKRVDARLHRDEWRHLEIGKTYTLINKDDPKYIIKAIITKKFTVRTFEEAFKYYGVWLLPKRDLDTYYKMYSKDDERTCGVVVFEIEVL